MTPNRWNIPDYGFGVGLRTVHYDHILEHRPKVDWFEIISETYLESQGRVRYVLDRVAEQYPIVIHGVSLSIGSSDPLNFDYLRLVKALADRVKAAYVSDHLCWTGVNAHNAHDLLPIVFNDESLRSIADKARQAMDFLERPLVLENVSTYVQFAGSAMPEWEFHVRLMERSGCGMLMDVNNIYVNAFNHGFDPVAFIDAIDPATIVQYHLAGHTDKGTHLLDTHNDHVIDDVWELYRYACSRSGPRNTLLEWDEDIPDFDTVHREARKARLYRTTEAKAPSIDPRSRSSKLPQVHLTPVE
jgi:uncharacterized protein